MGQWDLVITSIKESDLVLEVIDAPCCKGDAFRKTRDLIERLGKKLIIVINKSDLVPNEFDKKLRDDIKKTYDVVSVSTKERKGTGFLKGAMKKYTPKT